MSVSSDQFTAVPGGLLNVKALWPHLDEDLLQQQFSGWIDEAELEAPLSTPAQTDQATILRVKVRAWQDIYEIRLGNPSTVDVVNQGSRGYTQGQIDAAALERNRIQAELDDLLALDVDVEALTFGTLRSFRD